MRDEPESVDDLLPLPPATFHILLALTGEEHCGPRCAPRVDPMSALRAE